MKWILLIFMVVPAGCAKHAGQSHFIPQHPYLTRAERAALKPVTVTDCHGKLAVIYADNEMTTPMANPIWPDSQGNFSFWTDKTVCMPEEKTK